METKKCYNCLKMIRNPKSNKSGLCNSCFIKEKDKKRIEADYKRKLKKAREFNKTSDTEKEKQNE